MQPKRKSRMVRFFFFSVKNRKINRADSGGGRGRSKRPRPVDEAGSYERDEKRRLRSEQSSDGKRLFRGGATQIPPPHY